MSTFASIARTVRRGYRYVFRRQDDDRLEGVVDTLAQVSLFRTCGRSVLRDVAAVMHQRTYRRDEYLYYEDDPGLGMYVVQRGRVRLLKETEDEVVELRQVAEHAFCGELSLLGDHRRMESAQALTETTVLGFFRPDLKVLLKRNPQAGAEVVLALGRMLAAREVALVRRLAGEVGPMEALRWVESPAEDATDRR
ncbi:MAG: cyclic nucleotide-binding domain-containing protein [Bacteroidetes bacterium]|jgi:CRP-like cAMP-binding protein|nr:cyclic nucleotide-binding domain-containing protein [Bacteroidota bacterium]